ncbi:17648_t:CDS:1, partial [Cetraspora pellucida]
TLLVSLDAVFEAGDILDFIQITYELSSPKSFNSQGNLHNIKYV